MNPYNFAMVFFAASSFLLSILILLKRRDEIARVYFIFSTFVTMWGISWAIMVSDNVSYEVALTSSRLTHSFSGLVGVSWFHLCLLLSDRYQRYKKLLIVFYGISFISILFFSTPFYIPEVVPLLNFKHYTKTGPVLDFYMGIFVLSMGFGFLALNRKMEQSIGDERIQIRGLFIATLIGFIGGTSTILPIYGIKIPFYSVFMTPVYPFIMAYFMMRHRLFDLNTVADFFQREKLATIGLLAASVNHEIRNPLYAAKGILDNYLELDREGLKSKNPKEVTEKALNQINRALDVITKLNRFAKPSEETGGNGQGAKVSEAIQNVLDLVSYEFSLDKIKIINQIDPNLPLIQADQRQLEEILFNIIVNACHAMKEKGQGTLDIRSIVYDSRCTLILSDTGPGVSSNQMKHLFEPFRTTKGEKGTGLGLYITKQLVERNGGKISVRSKEGMGTSFILEFSQRNSPNKKIDFLTDPINSKIQGQLR